MRVLFNMCIIWYMVSYVDCCIMLYICYMDLACIYPIHHFVQLSILRLLVPNKWTYFSGEFTRAMPWWRVRRGKNSVMPSTISSRPTCGKLPGHIAMVLQHFPCTLSCTRCMRLHLSCDDNADFTLTVKTHVYTHALQMKTLSGDALPFPDLSLQNSFRWERCSVICVTFKSYGLGYDAGRSEKMWRRKCAMDVHMGRGLANLYAMSIYVKLCDIYMCIWWCIVYICDLFDIFAWYSQILWFYAYQCQKLMDVKSSPWT